MNDSTQSNGPRHLVVTSTKSLGIQILLILFLGPFGLFYSTVKGALITLLGVPAVFMVAALLFGTAVANSAHAVNAGNAAVVSVFGSFLLMIPTLWIVSFIWGAIAVKSYNAGLMRTVGA